MSATITTQNLNTLSPRQFDEELAEIYKGHAKTLSALERHLNDIHYAAKDRKEGRGRDRRWTLTDAEAKARVEAIAADATLKPWTIKEANDRLARLQEANEAVAIMEALIAERDDVFQARGGWARFFLVENVNGHIHSSMHCSSCRPTTQFSWLPSVSDKTEKEAVADHGPMLCTKCFPSAPVEWTNYWELEEARKQAEACEGSGTTDWVEGTTRFGFVAGNGGTCSHCNGYAAATASRNIRKHKPGK